MLPACHQIRSACGLVVVGGRPGSVWREKHGCLPVVWVLGRLPHLWVIYFIFQENRRKK